MNFGKWLDKFENLWGAQAERKSFTAGYSAALEEALNRIPNSKASSILETMVDEVKQEITQHRPIGGNGNGSSRIIVP